MPHPKVKDCALTNLIKRGDDRGSLVALEPGTDIPFSIARVYYVFATKAGTNRGFHAHRAVRQFAVAVSGSCTMHLDDGTEKTQIALDSPTVGLMIEPMIWHEMHDFSPDCVLLVLADAVYDEADYIRSYDDFATAVGNS